MGRRRFMTTLGSAGLAFLKPFAYASEASMDPENSESVEKWIEEKIRLGVFPGACLLASRDGKTFLEKYWGTYCGEEKRGEPVGPEVVHMLYSFSKGITATMAALAHADGRLDYDAPVCRYIPEFGNKGKDKITVRHLLTHSAGIPSVPISHALGDEAWQRNLDALCKADLEWPPGSRTAYHGWQGMFLAAEAVRRISSMASWESLCRKALFDPLDCPSFTFETPPAGARVALTHQPKELPCPVRPERFALMGHPGGGCFGTAADVLKFLNMHLQDGEWQGKKIIPAAAIRAMREIQYAPQIAEARKKNIPPAHENWGLGWLIRGDSENHWFGFGRRLSRKAFGHAGIDTVMGLADPESRLALVFITTDTPGKENVTVEIRNGVTDRVVSALERETRP